MAGVLLATAGYDHTIRFWEAPTGVCYKTLQHPDSQVNQLQITEDRQKLAAAGNPSLRLYDINSGTSNAVTSFDGHASNVTAVGFEANGQWMYTASDDGFLKFWDLRAARCQRELDSGFPINSVALHPNQMEILSGDRDGNIRVWDLAQNACSSELVPDGDKSIQSLSIAKDASTLAAANIHGSVFLWTLTQVSTAEENGDRMPSESKADPPSSSDCRPSPSAELVSRMRIEPLQKLQAHASYVIRCIISPDCKRLATTSADHTIKIWDMKNNFACEETLTGHQRWVWDAVFSADSDYLVTASSDQTARLWALDQAQTIQHYSGHHKAVTAVAMHDRPPDQ